MLRVDPVQRSTPDEAPAFGDYRFASLSCLSLSRPVFAEPMAGSRDAESFQDSLRSAAGLRSVVAEDVSLLSNSELLGY